jgi:Tol biopolymer transport system component
MACALAILAAALLIPALHAAAPTPASKPVQASASASGASYAPQFSADGQHLVFISHANNLVTNDNLAPWLDVFVRDLAASNTVLVSVNTNGVGGGDADANYAGISSNGRFVVFASRAGNLVAGDTNSAEDIFVRDLVAGTTRLVSVDLNGRSPFDPAPALNIPLSGNPMISADGRWVFFESRATNLITAGAPLGSVNIYARDTWSNVTVLVTALAGGIPAADKQELAGISDDGRFAIFLTTNTAFVVGITNAGGDVYLRDLLLGSTRCASSNVLGSEAGAYVCSFPALAAGGGVLAFNATTNGVTAVAVFEPATGAATLIASNTGIETPSNAPPVVSADGLTVAFTMHRGPSGIGIPRLLAWSRTNGTFTQFMQTYEDGATTFPGRLLGASGDGRRFTVLMTGQTLATNAPSATSQLYRVDVLSGDVQLISVSLSNTPSATQHRHATAALSPDGARVAFDSAATDLASADFNNANDVFLRDVNSSGTELISAAHVARSSVMGASYAATSPNSISADGRFVVFTRYDDPSFLFDTNFMYDVFLADMQTGGVTPLSVVSSNVTDGGGSPGTNTSVNTNACVSPIISADGSAVAMLRIRSVSSFSYDLMLTRGSNGLFTNGFSRAGFSYPDFSYQNPNMDSPSFSADGGLFAMRLAGSSRTTVNVVPLQQLASGVTNLTVWSEQNIFTPIERPLLSADGRWVSAATKAVPAGYPDIIYGYYAHSQLIVADLGTSRTAANYLQGNHLMYLCSYSSQTQLFTWFEHDSPGVLRSNYNVVGMPTSNGIAGAFFSADSRFTFYSLSNVMAVYRHDLTARQTNIYRWYFTNGGASVVWTSAIPETPNLVACTNCRNASVSADGNIIAFERVRAGGIVDLYATDLRDGREMLVSANLGGAPANGSSSSPLISGDGRYVVFQSKAGDLVASDQNGFADIFVRDRLLGVTMLVSANPQGGPGNGPSTSPVLGPDGRTVAFQSFASDLIPGDFNDRRDVFVLRLGGADTDSDGMDDDWEVAYFSNLARDGSGDFDADGVSDRDEFLAGTDPTNGGSVFRALTVASIGGGSRNIVWTGNPARTYRVEFKDDLNAAAWTALDSVISWNGGNAVATDPASAASRFYRVVRLP